MNQISQIISEVKKAVVGKDRVLIWVMTVILARGHILLEDIPGVGKTTMALAFSRALGLDYGRVQFTPDVLPSDITGYSIYNKDTGEMRYQPGAILCNLFLADELNRATSRTQSALLEAMEEGKVTVDGQTMPVPDPFMVIATQNPAGYVGTYPLPEAQLDRFAIKLSMGYPTATEEISIIRARKTDNPLAGVRSVLSADTLRDIRSMMTDVRIDDALYTYIVTLVTATRRHPSLALGASPRASVALVHLSQAYAFLHGRDYVIPDDIAALFRPAIAHRLALRQEAKLTHQTATEILGEILRTTEVPYKGKRDAAARN